MLLGLFGSMVVFYPVFKGLQKGKSVWDPTIFAPEFYDSFFDIFRGFGVGTIAGTVSLYCGILFFGFFVYYFLATVSYTHLDVYKRQGENNYHAFQYVSACLVPVLVYSGDRFVRKLAELKLPKRSQMSPTRFVTEEIFYLLLIVSCVPLYLYVPFVYGEISSTAFAMLSAWIDVYKRQVTYNDIFSFPMQYILKTAEYSLLYSAISNAS